MISWIRIIQFSLGLVKELLSILTDIIILVGAVAYAAVSMFLKLLR